MNWGEVFNPPTFPPAIPTLCVYGMCVADFTPIKMAASSNAGPAVAADRLIPPSNGFGSDEDSIGNCLSLIPKPPRRDYVRFMELDRSGLDGHVLRFVMAG